MFYLIKIAILLIFAPCWGQSCLFELQGETGYRTDRFIHSGHMVSPSTVRLKQEMCDLSYWQTNLKGRLTWNCCMFLQGVVGLGFAPSATDHWHGKTEVLVPPLTPNETPQPYDVQADPFDFSGEDILKRKESYLAITRTKPTRVSQNLYVHHHGASYAWTGDIALGVSIPIVDVQWIEPRFGYLYQSLHVPHATSTHLHGVYIGLSMPISWGNRWVILPDVSYIFGGVRRETIVYFSQFSNMNQNLHVRKGTVLGFRSSLTIAYAMSYHSWFSLILKYDNYHTGSGSDLEINPAVTWKPHISWQSMQFLAAYSYVF